MAAAPSRKSGSVNERRGGSNFEASYALIILQDNKTGECVEETLYCLATGCDVPVCPMEQDL